MIFELRVFKKEKGFSALFFLFGDYETVFIIVTLVNNIGASCVSVLEYEESMFKQIHLQYRLFDAHRFELEILAADIKFFFFFDILLKFNILFHECAVAKVFCKARFVLSDLALDYGNRRVDCVANIFSNDLAPEESAVL